MQRKNELRTYQSNCTTDFKYYREGWEVGKGPLVRKASNNLTARSITSRDDSNCMKCKGDLLNGETNRIDENMSLAIN